LRRSLPLPRTGWWCTVGEPMHEALPRVADMVKHALAESGKCRLLLENTAGAGNTIGRIFEELREVIDRAGGDKRIGVRLDSCHMFATGFDIRTADKLSEVMDRFTGIVGIRRLKSLHVNDSMTGSARTAIATRSPARARSEHPAAAPSCRSRASRSSRPSSRARARAATPRQGGRRHDEAAARAGPASEEAARLAAR
jgi:hypothetical protein